MWAKLQDNIKLTVSVVSLAITIISVITGMAIRYYEMGEITKSYDKDIQELYEVKDRVKTLEFEVKNLKEKQIEINTKFEKNMNDVFYYKYPYGQWGYLTNNQ